MRTNKTTFPNFIAFFKAVINYSYNFFSKYLFIYEQDIAKDEKRVDYHIALDFVRRYYTNQTKFFGHINEGDISKLNKLSPDDLNNLFLQILDIEDEVSNIEKINKSKEIAHVPIV